jgi:hypothetical protein
MCPANATESVPLDHDFAVNRRPANVFPDPVTWHSGLEKVMENVWIVRGGVTMTGGKFPTTMTIFRDTGSGALFMFNSIRFDDAFNQEILDLAASPSSPVHIVRLGPYHGMSDGFWCSKYERCKLWALPSHNLQEGLYADFALSADSPPPVPGSTVFVFDLPRPEAAVILPNRLAVFCDAVFNLRSFEYVGFRMLIPYVFMGFYGRRHCPGPIWLQVMVAMSSMQQIRGEFERLLASMDFDSYVSGHGVAEIGDAKQKIRDATTVAFRGS